MGASRQSISVMRAMAWRRPDAAVTSKLKRYALWPKPFSTSSMPVLSQAWTRRLEPKPTTQSGNTASASVSAMVIAAAATITTLWMASETQVRLSVCSPSQQMEPITRGTPHLRRYQTFSKVLGVGAHAKVVLGRDLETGRKVAVKCIRHRTGVDHANEVEVMRRIAASGGHDNVVRLLDVVEEPAQTLIVTELVPGEEMYSRLAREGPFPEFLATKFARSLAQALFFLHEQVGVAHCDLKPENVLFKDVDDSGELKVCDFGSAHLLAMPQHEHSGGTYVYWAPENFGQDPQTVKSDLAFGKEADMFAFGCILYICLYGVHPFDPWNDASEVEICHRIQKGEWKFVDELSPYVSPLAKDLVIRLLEPDPKKRITAAQVMQHPWIHGIVNPMK